MKIFLSWSGDTSRKVAIAIRDWLPCVFNEAKPFVSSEDIRKGNRWLVDVSQELSASSFGIICLTRDNLAAPWILFEAGALSKSLKDSQVCTLLLGKLKTSDIKGPLAGFQATLFEKDDVRKLVKSLNASTAPKNLPEPTLEKIFEKWWPDLEANVALLLKQSTPSAAQEERTEQDILLELLDLTRFVARNFDRFAQDAPTDVSKEVEKLRKLLAFDLKEIELTPAIVSNLNVWGVHNIGQLSMLTSEELKARGLRKANIREVSDKLDALGLSLGMRFDKRLLDPSNAPDTSKI